MELAFPGFMIGLIIFLFICWFSISAFRYLNEVQSKGYVGEARIFAKEQSRFLLVLQTNFAMAIVICGVILSFLLM